MAARRRSRASLGIGGVLLVGLAVLLVGGGGAFASLAVLGMLDAPRPKPVSREGLVRVPRTVRPLQAYRKVTRDDVVDLQRGDDSYLWVDPATLQRNPDWIVDLSKVIGRVMARDKQAGFVFQEKDFLPEGTREGVVAGIPPGKRAMVVSAEKIAGLRLLSRGDAFDLFATLPIKTEEDSIPEISVLAGEEDTLTGGTRTPESRAASIQGRLGVKLLVRGGLFVDTSERPGTETPASSRGPAKPPEKDITIAVSPDEVISLTHALALKYDVFCAARSGQPDDAETDELAHPLLRGMVAVPVRARPIRPLAAVTRDDLLDPTTGQLAVLYFMPGQVQPDWVTNVDDLIDRVAARDLYAGMPFREQDFQPRGTRRGVSGGTPPGKLAMLVPRDKIHGLSELSLGDRFDLIATLPVDLSRQFPQLRLGLGGQNARGYERLAGELQKEAAISLLAHNGAIVSVGDEAASITIAVEPDEVAPLAKALATDTPIYSIVRSGHAEENGDAAIALPGNPLEGIAVIEKLNGKSRSIEVFAVEPPPRDERPESSRAAAPR